MDYSTITPILVKTLVEILTIVCGLAISWVSYKAHQCFDSAKKKDTLGIIDVITDRAVEFAEVELKGSAGEEKRDYALECATKWLGQRGINITDAEILSGIENGVNKLKVLQANQISKENLKQPEQTTIPKENP